MADDQAPDAAIEEPPRSAPLHWLSLAACAVLFALVLAGTVPAMTGKPPLRMAALAAALVVGTGGISWHILIARRKPQDGRRRTRVMTAVRLTASGLAGAALVALLPNGAGYLLAYIALGGLGMDLPPVMAVTAGFAVFAATNVMVLAIMPVPVTSLVSNDVGAVFLLSIGAVTRSNRLSQARARAAQAQAEEARVRAERLVAELRAAQAAVAENAVLTERTRLAREVHDILAHSLTGLVLALDTAELLGRHGDGDPGNQARILEQVARAQRIARDGLADTRRAVAALRGDELPGPGLLDGLVRDISEATGLRATLRVAGEPHPLTPEAGLALYRTAQEALINSAKYAGRGGIAELRLRYLPDGVRLEVEDVRAADADALPAGGLTFGGYGLAGMRERAELLGGELDACPTDAGFRVVLCLPTELPAELAGPPRDTETV